MSSPEARGKEPEPLPSQRHLFEVPDDVAYLNTAARAPQLRSVREAGERAIAGQSSPWTISDLDWFTEVERLRELFARLVGGDADGVALVPATSYALGVAAANADASRGGRVLLIGEDYPSTVFTWRRWAEERGGEVVTVERGERGWTEAVLSCLDERVGVISVPNVHWTDGALLDLRRIGERAREVDALFAVDVTQSLGAMPLDVSELRPDYLVASGYKWLLGPFSVGYMWVAPEHRSGRPLEENWINRAGAEDFAGLTDYSDSYRPGARRFDVGQRTNFTLTPMAIAALEQLLEWGVERIAASVAAITARIEAGARERRLGVASASERGPHMLGITLPADRREAVKAGLAGEGVHVSVRASSLRISPHLHVTDSDLERFFAALDRALG